MLFGFAFWVLSWMQFLIFSKMAGKLSNKMAELTFWKFWVSSSLCKRLLDFLYLEKLQSITLATLLLYWLTDSCSMNGYVNVFKEDKNYFLCLWLTFKQFCCLEGCRKKYNLSLSSIKVSSLMSRLQVLFS